MNAYPVARREVVGERMVVASQPLAAQAGLQAMREGGNAVDAAVAAAAAIAVVEPTNNGVGGDAFAIVRDAAGLHGLNASGRAPRGIDVARYRALEAMPQRGWDSVTVPGAVSAWVQLAQRFGRLPFSRLLAPAIKLAERGFNVSPGVAEKWRDQAEPLREQPGFAQTFLPQGRPPAAGERFRQPQLAATLQRIAESRGEDFYRGQTAARIAAAAAQAGAALDAADLAAHRADWTTLLHADFRGGRLYEMPPNGQGVLALFALSVLQRHDLQRHRLDGAQSLHLQIEAIKVAFAELVPHLGDPDAMRHDVRQLLSPQRIAQAAARIDPDRASDYGHRLVPLAGTVYLAAGDRDGMMVSLIQSNYMGFGSGVVVPGTGVALQNRGACFATDADAVAAIGPGRRPFHTILPGFLDGDGVAAAFGATGGAFQPQGHVQLVVRLHPYAQPPQAAIDAPRFKIGAGRSVVLEPGFADATVQGLRQLGHDVTSQLRSSWDFGGMQMLQRRADCYWGACDWRRDSYIAVG